MNGNDVLDENGKKQYDYGNNPGVTSRPKASKFNVVGDLYENHYRTTADNVGVRSYAVFGGNDPVMGVFKGLSFSVNFGSDIRNRAITSYYNPYHGDGASVGGEVDKYATRTMSYTFNQILKYDRKFGRHHVLAQAGHAQASLNVLATNDCHLYDPESFDWVLTIPQQEMDANPYMVQNPIGSYAEGKYVDDPSLNRKDSVLCNNQGGRPIRAARQSFSSGRRSYFVSFFFFLSF